MHPDTRTLEDNITVPTTQELPSPAFAPQSPPGTGKPSSVTDALSYLNVVKAQLHDQPDKYDRFLHIMQEFHNQVIDTTGVLERITILFDGHPSLMQRFNTFLPVGYRIECSANAVGVDIITITTPTQVMQTDINGPNGGPLVWTITPHNSPPDTDVDRANANGPLEATVQISSVHGLDKVSPTLTGGSNTCTQQTTQQPRAKAQPQLPSPVQLHVQGFLERVKRAIDNKEVYYNFMELVDAFVQGRIGSETLFKDSRKYLGNGELLMEFRDIIGREWDRDEKTRFGLESPSLEVTEDRVGARGGFVPWLYSVCFCL